MNYSINIQSFLYQEYPDLSINDPVVPSAPPMETARTPRVNWKVLPPAPDPKWHQVEKIREAIKTWAFNLSLLTGLGTVYAAVWFTAKPIVVLCTFSGLAVVTLALAVTGLALSRLAPHPLDREFRICQRLSAEKEYQNQTLSFGWKNRYGETILSHQEWQELLQSDISAMTYSEFLSKHTNQVLLFLNEENRNSLKFKYIVHLTMNEAGAKGLKEVLQGATARYFDVTIDVLARDFVVAELYRMYQNGTGYQEFIDRNGLEAIQYVRGSNYHDWFVKKFIDDVNERMRGKGTDQAKRVFEKDFACFGEIIQKAALESVAWHSLHELIGKNIDYATFRQRNDLSHLNRLITQYSNIKEFLKKSYLTLSFDSMKRWSSDKEMLNIGLDEYKESLGARWAAMPIQEILQDLAIANDFFAATQEVFSPSDWTQKVVVETSALTIQQILGMSSTLLTSKILTAETVLGSGKTLKNQLEEEISLCMTLEQFVSLYPTKVLYDESVLCKNHAKVNSLVVEFMVRHPRQYLFASGYDNLGEEKTQEFIKNYVQIPEIVQSILVQSQSKVGEENSRFEQKELKRESDLKTNLQNINLEKKIALTEARTSYQIDNLKESYDQALRVKEAVERRMSDWTRQIQELTCEISDMALINKSYQGTLLARRGSIDTLLIEHGGSINLIPQMQADIARLEQAIADIKNQMEARLQNDSALNDLRREIAIFTEVQQLIALREQNDQLVQEVSHFPSVKALLRSQIAEAEKTMGQEVTGVFAAVGALASKSRYEREIKTKKKQISEMETKEANCIRLRNQIQQLEGKEMLKPYVSLPKTSINNLIGQKTSELSSKMKTIESQLNNRSLYQKLEATRYNLQMADIQKRQLDAYRDEVASIELKIQEFNKSITEKKAKLGHLDSIQGDEAFQLKQRRAIYVCAKNAYSSREEVFNKFQDSIDLKYNVRCKQIETQNAHLVEQNKEEHQQIYAAIQNEF